MVFRRIALIAATSLLVVPAAAHAAFPGENGRIAWALNRDIFSIEPNGTNRVQLTSDPAADFDPAFSPDGSKIAFVSKRDGNYEIYVMEADGTNPRRLTNDPGFDTNPAWSPDGSQIAFNSNRGSGG